MKRTIQYLIIMHLCSYMYAGEPVAPALPRPPAPLKVTQPAQLPEKKAQPAVQGLSAQDVIQTAQVKPMTQMGQMDALGKEILDKLTSIEQRLTALESKMSVPARVQSIAQPKNATTSAEQVPTFQRGDRLGERLQQLQQLSQEQPMIFQNRPVLHRVLEVVGSNPEE